MIKKGLLEGYGPFECMEMGRMTSAKMVILAESTGLTRRLDITWLQRTTWKALSHCRSK
jgi:hypothetical protein